MEVLIDPHAGVCPGVKRVIKLAVENVKKQSTVSYGELLHNPIEMNRLKSLGLKTIYNLTDAEKFKDHVVVIRAHGIPEKDYKFLEQKKIKYIEGTCPIVRRSEKIAQEFSQKGYQVIFIGKKGHAETISVTGHTTGKYVIIQTEEDIQGIDPELPSVVFAQTTVKEKEFLYLLELIKNHMNKELIVKNTICGFVKNRDKQIAEFASKVDVIVMVGGKHSSNTKWLFSICKENNKNAYWIESPDELQSEWFQNMELIGVTGSASTPMWIMEEVQEKIKKLQL